MMTKRVSDIEKGDVLVMAGQLVEVTHARKHRNYPGFYAIQIRPAGTVARVVERHLRGTDTVEVNR